MGARAVKKRWGGGRGVPTVNVVLVEVLEEVLRDAHDLLGEAADVLVGDEPVAVHALAHSCSHSRMSSSGCSK